MIWALLGGTHRRGRARRFWPRRSSGHAGTDTTAWQDGRVVLDHPRIHHLLRRVRDAPPSIGFPAAVDGNFTAFAPLLGRLLNNVGPPGTGSLFPGHTKGVEQEVIDFLAELFRVPAGEYGGYVTSGSTEGTLHALHLARTRLPGAVLYRSAAAHYSVAKACRLLAIPEVVVAADAYGQIIYTDLWGLAGQHAGRPAIVVANIGTTMTEAVDDVGRIHAALDAAGVTDRHVHADAALAGIPLAVTVGDRPAFDFADGADSIVVSGHKFLGVPMPCGAVLIRRHPTDEAPTIAYTGSPDSTITGSRNGLTALMMWTALHAYGRRGLRRRAEQARALAAYTCQAINDGGWTAWRHPLAMTVVLPALPDAVAARWPLPTENGISHIICMPGIRRSTIDAFLRDLRRATCSTAPYVSLDALLSRAERAPTDEQVHPVR